MNTFFPSRLLGIATAAALMAGAAGMAQAATTGATMPVSATVPVSCTAAAGTAMAFGSLTTTLALAVSQVDAVGSFILTCTNGASYSVVAGQGNNYSSGWRMNNGSNQYVTYNMYVNPGRSNSVPLSGTTWGSSGDGTPQTANVYGRVPAQTAGGSGSFTDSVTFTVTY